MVTRSFRWTGAAALVALAGCMADSPVTPTATDVAPSFDIVESEGVFIHVAVCKVGLDEGTVGQSFSFQTAATGGVVLLPQTQLAAVDEAALDLLDCALVWEHENVSYDSETEITITELVPDGFALEGVELWHGGLQEALPVVDGSVTVVPGGGHRYVVFKNSTTETDPPGRMTGGGFQIRVDGARVTRGLTLHCDVTLSNNLEINWPGGNNWHLQKESLESVECIDDPAYDPFPPDAPFDTFIARALGSLNGVENSIIDFRFIDNGEPGSTDEAHFTVYAVNAGPGQVAAGDEVVVLEVSGQLDGGNLQAHYDQPHR